MRPRDYVPLALLAGIAGFFVMQGIKNKRDRVRAPHASQPESTVVAAKAVKPVVADSAKIDSVNLQSPGPVRDFGAIQALIKDGAPGTYLLDMLAQQHDTLTHWPQRRLDAVRVFVDRYPTVADFSPAYPVVAERVFDEWRQAGFPLNFDFVTDSTQAEIAIRWVATLDSGDKDRLGTTVKKYDSNGWITHADIFVTTHSRADNTPLSPELIAGIARHEVGHALGLGHSGDKGDVMYPESNTPAISRADRATLHMLYLLPPGPTK